MLRDRSSRALRVALLVAACATALAASAAPAHADDAPVVVPVSAPCAAPAAAPCAQCAPCCMPWWCQDPCDGCCPQYCLRDPIICVPCLDRCIDQFQKGKADSCFKLGAGAYHWIHYDSQTEDITYGYPNGGEGTYFYYVNGDLECQVCSCFVKSIGGHAQVRFRDDTVFRSFFDEQVWFYEAYGFVETHCWGTLKAGGIWKRFGLDWDDSFWGNVAYYDGFKLDTDYGFSWEKVWNEGKRIQVDTYAQLFLEENNVNGSLAGADPESTAVFDEGPMVVLRAVPTWNITKKASLALGGSFLIGTVDENTTGGSHSLTGWAVDGTFTWCGFKAYAEYAQTDGVQNPAHYVTGGASDLYTDFLVGAQYTFGPFTPRATYSHGEYENPGGEQDLYLIGLDVKLTKWLTFTVEYVNWEVTPAGGPTATFEDGWQFVFHWDV